MYSVRKRITLWRNSDDITNKGGNTMKRNKDEEMKEIRRISEERQKERNKEVEEWLQKEREREVNRTEYKDIIVIESDIMLRNEDRIL